MRPCTELTGAELGERMEASGRGRTMHVGAICRGRSFRETEGEPTPIRRARAHAAVLDQCALVHVPGELLVGSLWGKMAPPDDALAAELEELRPVLEAVGRRHFGSHYDHHAPDYEGLLAEGLGGLRGRTCGALARFASDTGRSVFLESVRIALDGASDHCRRWADLLEGRSRDRAGAHSDLVAHQARQMAHLAESPPRTLWEAVQLVWITHTILQLNDHYAQALGRLDQYLYPFYRADIQAGRLTPDEVGLLLEHLFGKLTGIPGEVQNVCVGGLRPDGADATNELSFLILDACVRVSRPGGNVTARIGERTPRTFVLACAESIRSGLGYPALVNDDVMVPALVEQGWTIEQARDYCFVGCIETFLPGRQAPWSDSRLNLLSCVNRVIFRGADNAHGEPVAPDTGEPESWGSFLEAYLAQLRHSIGESVEQLNAMKTPFFDEPGRYVTPFLSALTRDCIERGRDVNDGGAVLPANHGVAGMGIGVTADALAAVKRLVYERGAYTIHELRELMGTDFAGREADRQRLLHDAPKYGNDDEDVDAIAVAVTEAFGRECMKHRTPGGGTYWGLMAANVQNVSAGREVGASPDGRRAHAPLSDAASPTFGRDVSGLTAALKSVARLPYHLCPGGNVVNVKLHPSLLAGGRGLNVLTDLVRVCFALGGAQLQFNTVDRDVLIEAMERPEDYAGLTVRVSGFSARFTTLDRSVQEDILRRTEHGRR